MPRKKGHTRGAGKHATGRRKSKGANLEQVLRREARDQPTAPRVAAFRVKSSQRPLPAVTAEVSGSGHYSNRRTGRFRVDWPSMGRCGMHAA